MAALIIRNTCVALLNVRVLSHIHTGILSLILRKTLPAPKRYTCLCSCYSKRSAFYRTFNCIFLWYRLNGYQDFFFIIIHFNIIMISDKSIFELSLIQ